MNWNVDFLKLTTLYLSSLKRRNIRVRWLYALLRAIRDIHAQFITYATGVQDEMKWNGQFIKLQRLLQLKFGAGIVIVNQDFTEKKTIAYPVADERNIISSAVADTSNQISTEAATGFITSVGFIVQVPVAITLDEEAMKALINYYQIGSSEYSIVRI